MRFIPGKEGDLFELMRKKLPQVSISPFALRIRCAMFLTKTLCCDQDKLESFESWFKKMIDFGSLSSSPPSPPLPPPLPPSLSLGSFFVLLVLSLDSSSLLAPLSISPIGLSQSS